LPEAAVRLRRGREPARTQAPRAVQPRRLHPLARARLRGPAPRVALGASVRLPRRVRHGTVPDAVPAGRRVARLRADDGAVAHGLAGAPDAGAAVAVDAAVRGADGARLPVGGARPRPDDA